MSESNTFFFSSCLFYTPDFLVPPLAPWRLELSCIWFCLSTCGGLYEMVPDFFFPELFESS